MKFRILSFAIAAFAAVAIVSCTREELTEPSVDGHVVLTLESSTPSTKTEWDGHSIIWSEGDCVTMSYTYSDGWKKSLYSSEPLAAQASKAAFKVTADIGAGISAPYTFSAVYPSSAVVSDFVSAPNLTVNVPMQQTPSATSFDKSADLMLGNSYLTYDSVPVDQIPMLWKRLVAHCDLTLSGMQIKAGEALETVSLTVQGASMTGDFVLDMSTGEISSPTESGCSDSVTADVSALSSGADGSLNVWLAFIPCKASSLVVEVVTDVARYVREISGCDLDFKVNTRNILTVDMSSAVRMTKPEDDSAVAAELFDILNLDYPGLEKVKSEYQAGRPGAAASALVDYFKARTSVVNPEVDVENTIMYTEDKRIAEQALEHRFCVRRGHWYESVSGTAYTYWDFDDASGNINWDFHVEEAGQEFYQKHWHQWFKFLAWAQVYYGDDKYFESWKEVYTDWLETYPCPGKDGNHNTYGNRSWHQLSVATRITNQLDLFPYFITSSKFSGSWMSTFLVEFHKAVEFSRANPYYEETSNIRFAQQTAQANAAMLFPEFKKSSEWLSEVAPQISDQFALQFYSDGVHTEMAPNYQLGVMDNFRAIYNIARVNNRLGAFDAEYTGKMRKACIFLANYIWPDYTWEWFNDTFQQTKGVLLNNIKRYSEMLPDENVLKYLASERKEGSVPSESLISFPVGGYYVLRSGWDGNESMLILKNNYNPENEWHCHMDNGTFALWSKGRDFLPDPGVYTYGGSTELDALRTQHLATASHNTLTKNLKTIAKNYSKGECLLTRTSASEDLVVTQNASYSDLTHRRAVYMLDKEFYVIVDEAFGAASKADVNLSFHLCEGVVKTDDSSSSYAYGVHTEFPDGNDMLLRTFAETSKGFVGETGTSRCSPKQNEAYDRTFYRVTVDKTSASDVSRFITVIYPGRSADISASFISAFSQTSSSVKVVVNGKVYDLSYTL